MTANRSMHAIVLSFAGVPLICLAVANASAGADSGGAEDAVERGLRWLASTQSRIGHWEAREGRYPTAMTALAGMALLAEGSTTTQGPYARNIRMAVDYLVGQSNPNGLIGDPNRDDRYTYGHGFSMLFLSQLLGEEEDLARREQLVDVLSRAVSFTGRAQTTDGGWGYLSAKDGNNFDEGSTTVTQVQGLRGCRNVGVDVPKEIIDNAIAYIHKCTTKDGGVQYSSKGGGGRPAITAAAVACLFNAGEYDSDYVPRLLDYCRRNLQNIDNKSFGHWHYAHYYYAQVMYREGGTTWDAYRDEVYDKLVSQIETVPGDESMGYWPQGFIGPVYTTAINLTILQLENGTLPIYQR